MNNKYSANNAGNNYRPSIFNTRLLFMTETTRLLLSSGLILLLTIGLLLPSPFSGSENDGISGLSVVENASANNTYANLLNGNLNFNLTSANTNLITTNDNWSNVPSVEGYFGRNLTATHGIDPQTVLGTEFTSNALPNAADTNISANKSNPNAFNAGGLAEFDSGTYLAIGFQGNVQANPYMIFYLNTTGVSSVNISYNVTDIDGGSNDAVSPIALQYRVGETGNFINLPDGYIADATDGPNIVGRVTSKSVTLPAAASNQAKVQIRLITTNAANAGGSSTPDEWIGVNNVVVSALGPSAAGAVISGRIFSPKRIPLGGEEVLMYDGYGNIRTAVSNPMGYYFFEEVSVGETYIFEIRSQRFAYTQPTQIMTVMEDYNYLYFYATPHFIIPSDNEDTVRDSLTVQEEIIDSLIFSSKINR